MKKIRKCIAILSAASLVFTAGVPVMAETAVSPSDPQVSPAAEQMTEKGEYAQDQVIAVFKGSVSDARIEKELDAEDSRCLEIAQASDSSKAAVADIGENESVEEAITKLEENNHVLYAQPNYRYKKTAADPYNNDEGMNQWYLTNIRAREAWERVKAENPDPATAKVKVAVIDTGADINHKDLQGAVSGVKIDGAEIKELKNDSDVDGHGTHTSGIIGAIADNGEGIAGIASGAGNGLIQILSIDATTKYDGDLWFDTFNLVTAIDYAKEHGAKVINMSLGGLGQDKVLEEAVEAAYAEDITIVAAAGNENTDEMSVPSDFGEVISVCNTTREDKRYASSLYGSNYGQAKDISAPGTSILSTIPGSEYANYTGTSMSAPMVSAAAALLYAVNPELTAFQVRNILCSTARDVDDPGFDYRTGYGVVDVATAVAAAVAATKEKAITQIRFKEDETYKKCIHVDDSEVMEVLTVPADSLEAVTWESDNESVVRVSETGKITGMAPGKAVITCRSAGGISAACTVYVNESNLPVSVAIQNQEEAAGMAVEDELYLDAQVLPRYADGNQVYWKSENKEIATVDETGLVTAKNVGTTRIMAYVNNSPYKRFEDLPDDYGELTAVVPVTVYPAVTGVSIAQPKTMIKLGSSYTFKAEAVPADTINQDVFWSSSNRAVAEIGETNGVLKTNGVGNTTIKAYVKNGKSASIRITVYKTSYSGTAYGLTAVSASYRSNKLTWKSIPNAAGYEIWRNGTWIKTVGGTARSYTDTKLKTGTKYSYKIRAFYKVDGKTEYCGFSSVKSAVPSLKAASVKTKTENGAIKISWSKASGASGYVVYKYSDTKKKYVKIKTLKTRTCIDKKVTKGKKYSYKVRAYRVISGHKIYGPYSKKAVRTCK